MSSAFEEGDVTIGPGKPVTVLEVSQIVLVGLHSLLSVALLLARLIQRTDQLSATLVVETLVWTSCLAVMVRSGPRTTSTTLAAVIGASVAVVNPLASNSSLPLISLIAAVIAVVSVAQMVEMTRAGGREAVRSLPGCSSLRSSTQRRSLA